MSAGLTGALALTVTLTVAFLPLFEVAVIVAVPALTAVTTPFEDTVATALLDVAHFTVVPSASTTATFTVAVLPSSRVTVAGATLIAGVTTLTVHLATFFEPSAVVAVIVAVPALTAVTTPFEDTFATFVLDDFHVTFFDVAFEGATVALSVFLAPAFNVTLVGATLTLVALLTTVTLHVAFFPRRYLLSLPFQYS